MRGQKALQRIFRGQAEGKGGRAFAGLANRSLAEDGAPGGRGIQAGKFTYTFSRPREFYLMERMKALVLVATVGPMDGSEDRSEPDQSHLEAAQAGDLAAFELLMRQYERLVLVTALRLLGHLEDAQDASQEVFLRLYRNLNKVGASGNLAGWLYRVTVNVCHDAHRKLGLAHQRRATHPGRHLARRASHVDVDKAGTDVGRHACRLRQNVGLATEDLDRESPPAEACPHSAGSLHGAAGKRLRGKKFGIRQRGAQLFADGAKRQIGDGFHRRKQRAGTDVDVADSHGGEP